MIVRGESTIIDYHAPSDQGLRWLPRVFTNTIAIERELEKET